MQYRVSIHVLYRVSELSMDIVHRGGTHFRLYTSYNRSFLLAPRCYLSPPRRMYRQWGDRRDHPAGDLDPDARTLSAVRCANPTSPQLVWADAGWCALGDLPRVLTATHTEVFLWPCRLSPAHLHGTPTCCRSALGTTATATGTTPRRPRPRPRWWGWGEVGSAAGAACEPRDAVAAYARLPLLCPMHPAGSRCGCLGVPHRAPRRGAL